MQAVIFDFDGIIVDSEPLHHQAFCQVLEPLNLPLSWGRYYEHYLGFDDRDVLRDGPFGIKRSHGEFGREGRGHPAL